jgi:hypothetical protein
MPLNAATPAIQGRPSASVRIVRAAINVPTAVLLAVGGLLMALIYYVAFTRRYDLATYGRLPNQSIAALNNMAPEGALIYALSFLALFALYWLVMRRLLRPPTRLHWLLIVGFAVLFNAVLLPMYPADAADIYDNIIRGRISAVYGLNPFHNVPSQIRNDPFFYLSAWHDVPSAYGPAWEAIASLTSRVVGNDYMANVVGFKIVGVLGYLLTALFIGLTLREIAPRRLMLGVYLYAWNPFVVYLTGSGGHNDTVMTALMLLSVYCLVRRWYAASTLSALLGALVKFIPVLMIPIIAVVALRELRGSARVRYVVVTAVAGALLLVASYGPYWTGLQTLSIERRGSMYTGSAATLLRQFLSPVYDGRLDEAFNTPNTNTLLQRIALALLAVFSITQVIDVWESRDRLQPIRAITAILLFYLLVSCLWFQSWYLAWVIPLAALLDNNPTRRLILYFSYTVTWQPLVYNYVTLRPDGWAAIPWRDLVPIAVVMGPIWGYAIWIWLSDRLRSARRSPFAVAVGQRLRDARERLQISPSELADRLNLRTDDLIGYEQGDHPLPLDKADALAGELGLSLSDLLAGPSTTLATS